MPQTQASDFGAARDADPLAGAVTMPAIEDHALVSDRSVVLTVHAVVFDQRPKIFFGHGRIGRRPGPSRTSGSNPQLHSLGRREDNADMTRMKLSSRYRQALHFAAELHEDQYRKGTDIPYVSHLMSVSALVLEYGGDEDQAIAGLLHDSIEDQSAGRGGAEALAADLARQFGAEVIRIVWACTDATVVPKPPWKERKLAYLEHLRSVDARVALVVAADKLHNARSIVADYYVNGDAIFAKFNAPKSETGWFYKSVSDTLNERHRGAVFEELERTVATLLELAHGNNGSATKRPKDIDADPTPLTDLGRSVICGPVGVQEGVP